MGVWTSLTKITFIYHCFPLVGGLWKPDSPFFVLYFKNLLVCVKILNNPRLTISELFRTGFLLCVPAAINYLFFFGWSVFHQFNFQGPSWRISESRRKKFLAFFTAACGTVLREVSSKVKEPEQHSPSVHCDKLKKYIVITRIATAKWTGKNNKCDLNFFVWLWRLNSGPHAKQACYHLNHSTSPKFFNVTNYFPSSKKKYKFIFII
jgi:hypothetical protein